MYAKVAVSAANFAIDKLYDYAVPERLTGKAVAGARVFVPFSRGDKRVEGIILELTDESEYENLKHIESVIDESPVLTEAQIKLAKWMKTRFFCTVYEAVKAMLPASLWYKTEDFCVLVPGIELKTACKRANGNETAEIVIGLLFAVGGRAGVKELAAQTGEKFRDAVKLLKKEGIVTIETTVTKSVSEKTVNTAVLAVTPEEAAELAEKKRVKARQQSEILKLLAVLGQAAVKEISYYTGAGMGSIKALERSGYIRLERREIFRKPEISESGAMSMGTLSPAQQEAYNGIKPLLESGEAKAALLYGVTGSGKTAVYIKLISDVIGKGCRAMVLVPEIALTPQLVMTFTRHFGQGIAVLHSSLTLGERYDEWRRIKSGLADVVVGTRSAVFAPVENLGLVIIDEEQESSYKSENVPRYHARDIAKYLCVENNALLLLGSATPSIESMYSARTGKYALFQIRGRYNEMKLPEVIVADMKKELRAGNGSTISSVLKNELERNIQDGRQSILFINRRGTNSIITCPECGYIYTCSQCSVNLTFHMANKRLMCHYCGESREAGFTCPGCGGKLKYVGYGTQKVEDELAEIFPGVEVLRMDIDTVSAANPHDAMLSKFERKNIPILVGTQMVAKGLNFENVTLVGVISADQSLYASDYRAQERTFSLITQVVGRSGRGSAEGRAVIQTFAPDNEIIKLAAEQNYDGFYKKEIKVRQILGSPPIAELYCLTVSGYDERLVKTCCTEIKHALEKSLSSLSGVRVLGPAPAPVVKVKNRYRHRVFISGAADARIRRLTADMIRSFSSDKRFRGVSVYGDINPAD